MKRITLFLPLAFLMILSCGKEEEKFETFGPQAFAYDLDSTWEVNAMVNVRGFEQRENSNDPGLTTSLSYSVDVITPKGKKLENIYSDNIDFNMLDKVSDTPVEAQFNLDTTYASGKYEAIFNIKDNNSGRTTTGKAVFDLTK
jgi:hypothetical protein